MTSVSPVTSTRFPHPSLALAGLLCIAGVASTARAATLGVQAAGGAPGAPVEVQVFLTGGNGQVAGVQVDIVGDPTCLAPVQGSGTKAECSSNPAIPKDLSTSIRPGPSVRALLLSMSDTEPIKQDTWLFTCVFNIDAATTAAQCPVNLVGAILSDSRGTKIPVTTTNGTVQITGAHAVAPGLAAPAVVAPGGVDLGGAAAGAAAGALGGAGSAGGTGGAAGAAGRAAAGAAAGAGIAVPGLPAAQAPAAVDGGGAPAVAGGGGAAQEQLTPSPARTVAAAATAPPAAAATPTAVAKTPSPHASVPPRTPTAQSPTPGTPTPKK